MITQMHIHENNRVRFSQARRELTQIYNDVEAGGVVVIERHNSGPVALMSEGELLGLLAKHYPLTSEVSFHEGQVSMWLEHLPVHAAGASFYEAAEKLADAALDYADSWREELRFTPNHEHTAGWVRRIDLARNRESLIALLLGE